MFGGRGGLYRRFLHRSKDMPRGGRNRPFDDGFRTRKSALNHARRRLERAYGMKGQCCFKPEELDELRQIFEFYDIDSSKTMDLSELNMALSALGYNASEKDVQDLAALMDVDGDMTMDFSEFCMIVEFLREEKGLEAELRDAFRCIDTQGYGYVTADELLDLLMTQGNTMSLKEASELIRFVDKNGDGKLDYEEFMRIILEGKNLSRSTTFYSTAPSSINSLRTAATMKSSSRQNVDASLEELSVSFKTAVSSNTNGTIAEIAESVQMCTLSPTLAATKTVLFEEKSFEAQGNDNHSPTPLKITSFSQDEETNEPEVKPTTISDQKDGPTKAGEMPADPPQRKTSDRARPKLQRTSGRKRPSVSIKVIGPNAGEVLGSVVLENPEAEDQK